ncbi:MAG: ECF-type sigma factor [Acidobacteriota bacterium]
MRSHPGEATRLLADWSRGRRETRQRLLRLIYQEMRTRARWRLRGERFDSSLQTTELIQEAYLRLDDKKRIVWRSREHFLAIASKAMQRVLIDRARRRGAGKRIQPSDEVPLETTPELGRSEAAEPIVSIDLRGALTQLARVDARQARLVELRFFVGLSLAETARELGLSVATVKREWRMAQAWLRRALGAGSQTE